MSAFARVFSLSTITFLVAFLMASAHAIDLTTLALARSSVEHIVIDNPRPQEVIELPDTDHRCSGSLTLISIDNEDDRYQLQSDGAKQRAFFLTK